MAGVVPRCMGFEVERDAQVWGELRDASDARGDAEELRARMQREGYLYLPGLLKREEVMAARCEVCERLAGAGYLDANCDPLEGIAAAGRSSAFMPETLAKGNLQLERVLYAGAMMRFWGAFFGEEVRHFDFTWFRSVLPGTGTASHCDVVYMGRGSQNLYTAWTPMGDIDQELGGLMVLEGSNNHRRLRETYCQRDVDRVCANRPGSKPPGGWLAYDPNQIRRSLGGRWLSTPQYRAGDVVVFSVFTVHCGLDNQTADRVRLSSDSRYQPASEPADERWIGPNPPAHGPGAKRAMIC